MRLEDRYEVLRPLSSGGGGQAYLAQDLRTGRQVVVKELFGAAGEGAPRELEVLRRLQHPGVQRYVDAFVAEVRMVPRLHLVTEWVPGASLAEVRATRRLGQDEVLDLIEQVLEILAWLHGRSPPLLHRDIKPANLILRDDGRVVLIDFGVATDGVHRTFQHTMAAGTLGYQAPEQIAGDPRPASDVYSVGVTALELLSGRAPQELLSGLGIRWQRAAAHLEPWLQAWLGRALAEDPEQRFGSAAQALAGLRRRGADGPEAGRTLTVSPPEASSAPSAPGSTGGVLIPALAAGGMLVVGAAALGAFLMLGAPSTSKAPELAVAPTDPAVTSRPEAAGRCEDGDPAACLSEAERYRGTGDASDLVYASELTAKACLLGSPDGCWSIAKAYDPDGWLTPDPKQALGWWIEACMINTTNACDVTRQRAHELDAEVTRPLFAARLPTLAESCGSPQVQDRRSLDAIRCATAIAWAREGRAGPRDVLGFELDLNQRACERGAIWACPFVATAFMLQTPPDPIAARGLQLWICEQGLAASCDKADQLLLTHPESAAAVSSSPLR